jgi:hypothetical protein
MPYSLHPLQRLNGCDGCGHYEGHAPYCPKNNYSASPSEPHVAGEHKHCWETSELCRLTHRARKAFNCSACGEAYTGPYDDAPSEPVEEWLLKRQNWTRKMRAELPTDSLFHSLWTKAVGTPGYNKGQWKALEGILASHPDNKRTVTPQIGDRELTRRAHVKQAESGPGITKKSFDEHYWHDEDLLCEDAP